MAQEPIVLSEIRNKEDLKKILKFLDEEGFNINSVKHPDDYHLNNYKNREGYYEKINDGVDEKTVTDYNRR